MRDPDLKRAHQDRERDVLDGEARPGGDQANRDVVWQRIGPRWPGGLHIELLEHLDRKCTLVAVEQRNRAVPLGRFLGIAANGIEEDVRIDEVARAHQPRRWTSSRESRSAARNAVMRSRSARSS